MSEEKRAKRLCDAIDALLRGEQPEMALDDQELIELLRIARLRHRAGKALADIGLTYQELLRRVLQARLIARQIEQGGEKVDDPPPEVSSTMEEDSRESLDPLHHGYGELLNFLDFQPRTAPVAASVQTVTRRVRPPIACCQGRPRTRTLIPRWLRRSDGTPNKVEALSAALDRLASSRKRTISVGDPDIDELIQVARLRRFVGQTLAAVGSPYKRRLWAVLRMRLAASARRQSYYAPRQPSLIAAVGRLSWRQAAAAAAVIALLLAALGPLPATGFADHPIAHLLNLVEQHVGVEEVDGSPPTQVPTSMPGEPVPLDEAQSRLGLPLKEPSYLPQGFQLASSLYYLQSITSPEEATFALVYTIGGADPTTVGVGEPLLLIYQERATSVDVLWVQSGQAEDVLLAGSVPGTYMRGIWTPGTTNTLQWSEGDAQSLLFKDGDVQTFITYRNGGEVREELLRIAESMLSQ